MTVQKKRVNKSKDEVAAEMKHKAVVAQQKELVKKIFAAISNQDTVFDAQTVLNALSGFIKYELQQKEATLKINDLLLDLSKQPKGKISKAMEILKAELQNESAKDIAMLLERFGNTLGQYSAATFMKNKMSKIKIEDILA
jgi:anionic cell wall polymer biosynthesis LytR-Cps2A-Psr (LCP) family protein